MRIKLDENIAASAAERLTALGHDVHTVISLSPLPTKYEFAAHPNPEA